MSEVGVIDKYEATGSGLEVLPSRAQTGALHEQAGGPGTLERTLTRRNNVIKVGIHVHTNRDLPMLEEAEPSEYAHYAWHTTLQTWHTQCIFYR